MRRRWLTPVAALALAGGSMLVASVASASTAAPRSGHVMVQPGGPAHLIRTGGAQGGLRNATSTNWSGYAAHSGTYTSVSSSWTEPTGTCTSGDQYSSFWVGLDGYSSDSVEQTGSEVDCDGSTPQYYAWYEMYPAYPVNFSNTVKPGDHFTGSVTYEGSNEYQLTLSDTTQGWTQTENKTSTTGVRSSAEVIIEAPYDGGVLPLADFGTVKFTATTVDGSSIGSIKHNKITMADGSTKLDKISNLTGGTNFTGKWLASS
jgi:hypothetical protein